MTMASGSSRTGPRSRGQVFSIDVLFSLLPIVMIIGASLQYMYLAEEDSKTLVRHSELQGAAQAMSEYTLSKFQGSWNVLDPNDYYEPYVNSTCNGIRDAIADYAAMTGDDKSYIVLAESNFYPLNDLRSKLCGTFEAGTEICGNFPRCNTEDADIINNQVNDTAASIIRFMPEFDDDGNLLEGHIASVTFTVWDKR